MKRDFSLSRLSDTKRTRRLRALGDYGFPIACKICWGMTLHVPWIQHLQFKFVVRVKWVCTWESCYPKLGMRNLIVPLFYTVLVQCAHLSAHIQIQHSIVLPLYCFSSLGWICHYFITNRNILRTFGNGDASCERYLLNVLCLGVCLLFSLQQYRLGTLSWTTRGKASYVTTEARCSSSHPPLFPLHFSPLLFLLLFSCSSSCSCSSFGNKCPSYFIIHWDSSFAQKLGNQLGKFLFVVNSLW